MIYQHIKSALLNLKKFSCMRIRTGHYLSKGKDMKILICYPGTIEKSGGMQHICAQFSNAMSERGHQVAIAWYGRKNAECFYPISQDVMIFSLKRKDTSDNVYHDVGHDVAGYDKVIREILKAISRKAYRRWNDNCKRKILSPGIRRTVEVYNPDVIISFSKDMTYFLSGNVSHIPVVTMMHIDPMHAFADSYSEEIQALDKSNVIQVLVPSYIEAVRRFCPSTKVVYIPNPIRQAQHLATLSESKKTYRVINMARLNKEQKRQHILVEAFSRVADEFPDWILELWGDNKTYPKYVSELNHLIQSKHLESRIFIKGATQKAGEVYASADILGFPSAYEGFSLALMEAMSAGLPVVAFKSCPSVNEVVRDGIDGYLSDDNIDSFTEKLRAMMLDKNLRIKMGDNAHKDAMKYAPDRIWKRWENLMNEVKGSESRL